MQGRGVAGYAGGDKGCGGKRRGVWKGGKGCRGKEAQNTRVLEKKGDVESSGRSCITATDSGIPQTFILHLPSDSASYHPSSTLTCKQKSRSSVTPQA